MPPEQRLTPAQYRVLEEVDAGRVFWDRLAMRYRSTVFPPSVRRDVLFRLVDGDYVRRGQSRGMGALDVVLTNRGREALAQHRSQP